MEALELWHTEVSSLSCQYPVMHQSPTNFSIYSEILFFSFSFFFYFLFLCGCEFPSDFKTNTTSKR